MSFCQLQHCKFRWQIRLTSYYMLQVRGLHSYLNCSCTEKISVKRSIGIHPTKNVHTELQQHTCIALKTKLKLHHAQLTSAPNFWELHSCTATKIEKPAACTFAQGPGAEDSKCVYIYIFIYIKNPLKNLTGLAQPGVVQFNGKDDSCGVKGALHSSFGLFWKIKQAEKDPAPPTIQNHLRLLKGFN